MSREPERWGGEVRLPRWLRRRRKPPPSDTPEKLAEARRGEPDVSVLEAADRAVGGAGIMFGESKRNKASRQGDKRS